MFGLNMRIQRGIREVAQFTSPTDILPTFFILPSLPYFLLLLIALPLGLDIILDHVVVDHIHLLMRLCLLDDLLVVALADGEEIFRGFGVGIDDGVLVALRSVDCRVYK